MARAAGKGIRVRIEVTWPLPYANTPLDPTIDFSARIREAKATGFIDWSTLRVINEATGADTPYALSSDFDYGDKGRVEFVIANPQHRRFLLRFQTAKRRSPPPSPARIPAVGVGDLLRYNAGRPMPIAPPYCAGLHDMNGDGRLDLVGTWNYARRPGEPWDGVVCYPGLPGKDRFRFGRLMRPRFEQKPGGPASILSHIYMTAAVADFDRDGRPDLVVTRRGRKAAEFFRNTGRTDPSGLPRFVAAGTAATTKWQACRAVDLDGDGPLDLVIDGQFVRNENPLGWPFRAAHPHVLYAGRQPDFLDVDGDGRLDAVCLQGGPSTQPEFYRVAWRRNRGGTPPQFGDAETLGEIALGQISQVATWRDAGQTGLLVQHAAFQRVEIYEWTRPPAGQPRGRFVRRGQARSPSAVLALGDQAWPCLADWDNDGDVDLIVGGGYGWPQLLLNSGGPGSPPAFGEAQRFMAAGQTIRYLRNRLLGKPDNVHNMGYPYPVCVDWDADGRQDLVVPNETNRIFWHRNVGSTDKPQLGPSRQIQCDGYPDSPAMRSRSNRRANDRRSSNGVYPYEKERPFFWRTGAAVADFNGDGLPDLVTHDGSRRLATLFTRYRAADRLRLRRAYELKLRDGRPINDAIVRSKAHWTESFRAVDWDQDGRIDLIYCLAGSHHGLQDGGSIYLLRNVGDKRRPVFAAPVTMRCFGEPIRVSNHGPHAWPGDFDGDGKPDLVACVEWSVYPYYCHAALMMKKRPEISLTLLP